jgi:predicted Zn-dependent protease
VTERHGTPEITEPDVPIEPSEAHDTTAAAPKWLVILVGVLAVAVVGTGAFAVLTITGERRYAAPEDREIRELSAVVERNPRDLESRLALAYAYQQAGRFDRALAEYEIVLTDRPDEPAALYNTGLCLLAVGREAEGEESLETTLESWPAHALAATVLSERLAERGQWAEIAEILPPVLDADEQLSNLQALLGRAYEELGETQRAGERYRLALKYDSDLSEALEGVERLGVAP